MLNESFLGAVRKSDQLTQLNPFPLQVHIFEVLTRPWGGRMKLDTIWELGWRKCGNWRTIEKKGDLLGEEQSPKHKIEYEPCDEFHHMDWAMTMIS